MSHPLPLLQPVLSIAQQAAALIMEIYGREFSVEHKADRTPVTEADLVSHDYISAALAKLHPTLPVLTEESAEIPYATRRRWQRYWLVDPLDGTQEFVRRSGEFTVNIALIEDQVATLGVVLCPVEESTYYGVRNAGAFRIDAAGRVTQIQSQTVSGVPRVAFSRSEPGERLRDFLNKLGQHQTLRLGSSLKSCRVAEGGADIYPRFGLTGEWDTAAAQVIVEEAGGLLADTNMNPLRYNTKASLLNPDFLVIGDKEHAWQRHLP